MQTLISRIITALIINHIGEIAVLLIQTLKNKSFFLPPEQK